MLKGTPASHTVVYKDPCLTATQHIEPLPIVVILLSHLNPTFQLVYTNTVSTFFYQRLSLSKFFCTVNVEELGTKLTQSISIENGLVPTSHSKLMLVVVTFLGGGVVKYISKKLLGTTVSILKTMGWLTH